MNRELLVRTLELLERTYPTDFSVINLTKKLGVSVDGDFSKIIRYLRAKHKIIATERLQFDDRISINPDGIDFLIKLKDLEINEKRNKLIVWATIVIAFATLINVLVSIFIR